MFGRGKSEEKGVAELAVRAISSEHQVVVAVGDFPGTMPVAIAGELRGISKIRSASDIADASQIIFLFTGEGELRVAMELIEQVRAARATVTPGIVVCLPLALLTQFGDFLASVGEHETLRGMRVLAVNDSNPLYSLNEPSFFAESNLISMPIAPEADPTARKNFFMFSPALSRVTVRLAGMAENQIDRIYLLGGPGTGKTSLAYYYWLCRNKGRFIVVNLAAEATDDKASMKSLLCGHVTGAFPGAAAREGALSFADDGVCFLDESHGITGVVMQVLMEVLDSGQYMPFGGVAKRKLKSALLFASNRSWETLTSLVHIDELSRIGGSLVEVPDLKERIEDFTAVIAVCLANFKRNCTSWNAPQGISAAAWQELLSCAWRGNVRSLIRVLESACLSFVERNAEVPVLDLVDIVPAIRRWEPVEHQSYQLYTSSTDGSNQNVV